MSVKKSPEGMPSTKQANLEKKRGMFFQIGFIVSLSLVLLAFEWTTVRTGMIDWDKLGGEVIDEEFAKVTIHKKKKLEIPKPKIIRPIEAVTNDLETDEDIEINIEVTDDTRNELDFKVFDDPDEVAEEPQIFFSSEQQPIFPGGLGAMRNFLSKNIKYPKSAREIGIVGTVHVEFVVWNDGSVRHVNVLRGIGGGCDVEAMRVISSMPDWNPGIQRTKPVNVRMVIPITFNLSN